MQEVRVCRGLNACALRPEPRSPGPQPAGCRRVPLSLVRFRPARASARTSARAQQNSTYTSCPSLVQDRPATASATPASLTCCISLVRDSVVRLCVRVHPAECSPCVPRRCLKSGSQSVVPTRARAGGGRSTRARPRARTHGQLAAQRDGRCRAGVHAAPLPSTCLVAHRPLPARQTPRAFCRVSHAIGYSQRTSVGACVVVPRCPPELRLRATCCLACYLLLPIFPFVTVSVLG